MPEIYVYLVVVFVAGLVILSYLTVNRKIDTVYQDDESDVNPKQITTHSEPDVHLVDNTPSDLLVANAARTSFNKWKDAYDEKDKRLINYLAKHHHISPFFHARFNIRVSQVDHNLLKDRKHGMGAVVTEVDDSYLVGHSFYGWIDWIVNDIIDGYNQVYVAKVLCKYMPDSFAAYDGMYGIVDKLTPYGLTLDNLDAVDVAVVPDHLKEYYTYYTVVTRVSIPVARQLYTHRLIDKNEMSRRYVTEDVTYYKPEIWRQKPEGSIKQGSSNVPVTCVEIDHPYFKDTDDIHEVYMKYLDIADSVYNGFIDSGVAPEMARMLLPLSMETKIIHIGSYDSWMLFKSKRVGDSSVQEETAEVASKMIACIEEKWSKDNIK